VRSRCAWASPTTRANPRTGHSGKRFAVTVLAACLASTCARNDSHVDSSPFRDVREPDAQVDASADAPPDVTEGPCSDRPPRQIAPLSSGTVPSNRPAFRVRLAAPDSVWRLQICSDRGCSRIEREESGFGDVLRAGQRLREGIHYWRAGHRSCASGDWMYSQVWQFDSPYFDDEVPMWSISERAPPLPWFRYRVDFDADGFADLAVGAPASERIVLFFGGSRAMPAVPTREIVSDSGPGFGSVLACAGDTDGDGFADLAVATPGRDFLELYRGGTDRFPESQRPVRVPLPIAATSDVSLSSADDLDGDGYGDVLVGFPSRRLVVAYYGSLAGLAETVTIPAPTASVTFGSHLSGGGDQDADGVSDIAIGDAAGGSIYVYRGIRGVRMPSLAATIGPPATNLTSLAWLRDGDGDGRNELAIGAVDGHSWVSIRPGNDLRNSATGVGQNFWSDGCASMFVAAAGRLSNPRIGSSYAGLCTGSCRDYCIFSKLFETGVSEMIPTLPTSFGQRGVCTNPRLFESGVAALGSPGDFDGDGESDRFLGLPEAADVFANFVHEGNAASGGTLFASGPPGFGAAIAR